MRRSLGSLPMGLPRIDHGSNEEALRRGGTKWAVEAIGHIVDHEQTKYPQKQHAE